MSESRVMFLGETDVSQRRLPPPEIQLASTRKLDADKDEFFGRGLSSARMIWPMDEAPFLSAGPLDPPSDVEPEPSGLNLDMEKDMTTYVSDRRFL